MLPFPKRLHRPIPSVLVLIAAGAACGCAGRTAPATATGQGEPQTLRSARPSTDRAQSNDLNQAALDLQALFDQQATSDQPDAAAPQPSTPVPPPTSDAPRRPTDRPADRSARPGPTADRIAPAAAAASSPDPTPPQPDTRSLAQRQRDAAQSLADLLRPEIGAAREPIRAALPLLALNAVAPGSAQESLKAIEESVSGEQRRSLDALRAVLRAAETDPDVAAGEPAAVARVLKDYGERLQPAPPPESLSIARAVLCTRVEAFGRYTPVSTSAFLAGRPSTVILYTEPRNFAHAAGRAVDAGSGEAGYVVELAQSVTLHLDADGSEQLVVPEVVIKDASRSQRRDFYLVQRLELPRTLSVGRYNLKVRIRDVVGGSVAEMNIPLRVVADASAARSQR